jgi:protein-S-isoprenylcysteine O-methyltransferase Ste14
MPSSPWWRGARGEWYVVVQFILLGLVLVAPWLAAAAAWPAPWAGLARVLGVLLLVAGAGLAGAGLLSLGRHLSPLPHPKADAVLVDTGVYGLVRHPIYSGLILGCLGWALVHNSLLTLVLAALVFVFFDVKARREERALAAHLPGYAEYCRRVHRFIPFIY